MTQHSIDILGIRIDHITMDGTLDLIKTWMADDANQLHQICTANPEFVMKAQEDASFQDVLAMSDLNIPDGIGLVIASKLRGKPLPERVAGSELVYHLAEACAAHQWRLFLLGAMPGIAERAAVQLTAHYPSLQIAGTHSGSPSLAENDEIVERVGVGAADILYVAYGAPNQDKWIARNRDALAQHGVRVAIGVGGSLDFIAGERQRAPQWTQNIGMEWLYRLIQEPWRWRRMLALPRFVVRVLSQNPTI